LIAQYFGDIRRGGDTPPVECKTDYAPGPRTQTYDDPLATLPAVLLCYRIPGHTDAATRPLQLLNTILGQGESSRLHRSLVRDARTALQAGALVFSRRGPGLFVAYAIANQGVSADTLAAHLAAQMARIAAGGVGADELTKGHNDYRAREIFGRQTTQDLAEQLQHYAHYHDSLSDVHTDLDRYLAVTADDVRAAARRYLVPANSLTLIVRPKAGAGGGE
jgi:zinc protease